MKIGEYNVLIGADPEVFVTRNGKLESAHNLIQGTKEEPFPVKDGAVQVDGMALEFNINPADNSEEFIKNVDSVLAQLGAMVPEYELHPMAVAEFGAELMAGTPQAAKEMGCDPDYNAWEDGRVNVKPDGEVDFRTGAGHIHIGWTNDMPIDDPGHVEACKLLVKQLDYYLGLPSVLLDDGAKRRELYGKAGAYRVKPYGVEYRVLSNFWLKSPALMQWAYDNTILAFKRLLEGEDDFNNGNCVAIINRSDKNSAKLYTRHYNIPMPKEA